MLQKILEPAAQRNTHGSYKFDQLW
jgi:hypothetical protein